MDQLGFDRVYRPKVVGNEIWNEQLELLRAIVKHLTAKEVCWEIGITDAAINDALAERDRKRWAAKWTHIVKAMLARRHDEVSVDLLQKLCEADVATTQYVVSEPHGLSPEEENAIYRSELSRTEEGRALVARVKSKGKKK